MHEIIFAWLVGVCIHCIIQLSFSEECILFFKDVYVLHMIAFLLQVSSAIAITVTLIGAAEKLTVGDVSTNLKVRHTRIQGEKILEKGVISVANKEKLYPGIFVIKISFWPKFVMKYLLITSACYAHFPLKWFGLKSW